MTPCMADIMREVRNCFPTDTHSGAWTLKEGVLSPDVSIRPGGWLLIGGSTRNNGIHQLSDDGILPDAADECWVGFIQPLAPPTGFERLCAEIAAWCEAHPVSALKSESFGDYAMVAAQGASGAPIGWQEAFAKALLPYRRMFREVDW